jgi:hypothetical protein
LRHIFLFCAAILLLTSAHAQFLPPRGLSAAQLALVVNDEEPNSVEIGEYYRQARGMPAETSSMCAFRITASSMQRIPRRSRQIDAKLGPQIGQC